MKVLFCSSEVNPFSKTGGLADVAAALPKALAREGVDIRVVTPYYSSIKIRSKTLKLLATKDLIIIDKIKKASYYEYSSDAVKYYFIQCDDYFKRENLYNYYDEAERFAFFNYAILEGLEIFDFYPDIIHVNDWQTALIPYFLDEIYRQKNQNYYRIKTLLTIHNMEYQGSFPLDADLLMPKQNDYTYIHFNRINYLKTGIMRSSAINTVSKTYKEEIMTQKYGFSLDGSLRNRASQTFGILNGIDYEVYNPETDPGISHHYNITNYKSGKNDNKKQLLAELGFPEDDIEKPLLAYIGRLAHQKGIDLLPNTITNLITSTDANFILIGSGETKYADMLAVLAKQYPNRLKIWIGFNPELSKKTYAAADLFMMPSEFEPCGLGQLIAMRYGTIPIVRETGGLADTVLPYHEYGSMATGFSFTMYQEDAFNDALMQGIDLYHNPMDFNKLIENAMQKDFSTDEMAQQYQELYMKIKKEY